MEGYVMEQYGFFFDQSRCSGCRTCAVACKIWNELPPGPLKYLKIYEYEKGAFPDIRVHFQWIPCYHCEEPACVSSCPHEAIYKEKKYGAVLIDSEKCDGCRICYDVCPYGSPVFESDESGVKPQKCNMCIDRLEMALQPVCVLACPNRALDFGPLSSLIEKYGDIRELEDMPGGQNTSPAVLFKPHSEKRQLVPYNTEIALELLMNRDQLPSVFKSPADILEIPEGMIGRSVLVIKHQTSAELMCYTRNDEG
jgi:anaerobic dimethyl sulfoxide reductase subunit B (iron-sulfur subunit)